ncbi:F0F1 ATP synthase subunit gamma [Stakelama sp. CBK3Z-3]|uniref:F0F1 ATP synthase subunit gamma n=1 Tax=Stakelama flava TaxID=2860338 RepID=A0ABS6XJ65_9SPHN|nr:F0F1 ATP synthase subunit gamma [Stakelama flava]MBW4330222.1 F0F1 ATP synthase subunit gamma [Stakelama flava]
MSNRLADVGHRIETVHQLGAVVNAMRGIAGARAQQSRTLLPAVRAYAHTATRGIAQARTLDSESEPMPVSTSNAPPGLVLFGAEQGFAGAFPEQAVQAAQDDFAHSHVFLVGTRAAALTAERGHAVAWQTQLPGKANAVPRLAMEILDAVYAYLLDAGPVPIVMVYPVWQSGHGAQIVRRPLLPFAIETVADEPRPLPPLTNLPARDLIARLVEEYVFAMLCEAALDAFAAENEARMKTMAAAKTHIDGKLDALRAEERLTRQEEITAEVVELAAGSRSRMRNRQA